MIDTIEEIFEEAKINARNMLENGTGIIPEPLRGHYSDLLFACLQVAFENVTDRKAELLIAKMITQPRS